MMTKHVISYSGGKDSTAMYLLALELGIDFIAVCADTGNESPITMEYVRTIHEKTGGPECIIVKADFSDQIKRKRMIVDTKWRNEGIPDEICDRSIEHLIPTGKPFIDLCLWKGRFPSTIARFCTSELKVIPIMEQIIMPLMESHGVFSWMGIRASESRARANAREIEHVGGRYMIYRPILSWNPKEVFAIHKKHNVEPNPLYKMGMARVGCFPCIHSGKREITELAKRFPKEIARIEEWERILTYVAKRGAGTFFPADTIPGEGDTRSSIRNVVKWAKTSRGGRQYNMIDDLFDDGNTCSSQYGLCE